MRRVSILARRSRLNDEFVVAVGRGPTPLTSPDSATEVWSGVYGTGRQFHVLRAIFAPRSKAWHVAVFASPKGWDSLIDHDLWSTQIPVHGSPIRLWWYRTRPDAEAAAERLKAKMGTGGRPPTTAP